MEAPWIPDWYFNRDLHGKRPPCFGLMLPGGIDLSDPENLQRSRNLISQLGPLGLLFKRILSQLSDIILCTRSPRLPLYPLQWIRNLSQLGHLGLQFKRILSQLSDNILCTRSPRLPPYLLQWDSQSKPAVESHLMHKITPPLALQSAVDPQSELAVDNLMHEITSPLPEARLVIESLKGNLPMISKLGLP